jgi:hypothetical protein
MEAIMDKPSGEIIALAGVVVGFALNAIAEAFRRRADRKEKTRELTVARGEELLRQLEALYQWSEKAREVAFTGDVHVPVQIPVFRVAAIVEVFYPSLGGRARDLDSRVTSYRNVMVDIAANKRSGKAMTEDLMRRLAQTVEQLPAAIGQAIGEARDAVRAQLSS